MSLVDGTLEEKLTYALEGKAPNLLDEMMGKKRKVND